MGGRLKLGQMLISKKLISPDQLASALSEQEEHSSRLGTTLVRMGFLEEESLLRVLASQLRLPVARIAGKTVNSEIVDLVPFELAEKYRCMPLFLRGEKDRRVLMLAMEDPSDSGVLDEIAARVEHPVKPVLVAPTDLEDALARHYDSAAPAPKSVELPPVEARPEPQPRRDGPPVSDTKPELPPLELGTDPAFDDGFTEGPEADSTPMPEFGDLLDMEMADEPSPDDSFESFEVEPPVGEPEFRETVPDFDRPEREPARHPASEPHVILRALSQLLVEKGILTREELAERLQRVLEEES